MIEELDRYRRSDEWTHSYHNIYTTTVLECKWKLMKAGVIPQDPMEFAQYVHDGTADHVRLKAWEALVDLGLLSDDSVSSLLLNVLSTDPSPYVRSHLLNIFCLGLASIAFDENKIAEAPRAEVDGEGDVLIIDEEASNAARKAHIARTTSIDGAIDALKKDLEINHSLKEAIWKAVQSPTITLYEEYDLLDICWVLYDRKESLTLKLRYPRFWKVQKLGKVRSVERCLIILDANYLSGQVGLQGDGQVTHEGAQTSKVPAASTAATTSKDRTASTSGQSRASGKSHFSCHQVIYEQQQHIYGTTKKTFSTRTSPECELRRPARLEENQDDAEIQNTRPESRRSPSNPTFSSPTRCAIQEVVIIDTQLASSSNAIKALPITLNHGGKPISVHYLRNTNTRSWHTNRRYDSQTSTKASSRRSSIDWPQTASGWTSSLFNTNTKLDFQAENRQEEGSFAF